MIKITEIKKLKRLYKITLDGADVDKIYVCEDSIVHFFLTRDKTMTETELLEVTTYDQFAQGKALAIYYISFKSRTKKEVRRYLIEHEIDAGQIERVLSALIDSGLINDHAYAENFIQGKISMASAGPFQIKQKLLEKGISSDLISEVLAENYDDETQIEVAIKLAKKLIRSKANRLTLNQLKQKIAQSLTSKGFSYSISSIAIDSLELEADEENELDLLYEELDKAYQKYARNYEGYDLKNRVTQAMARKGFDFGAISSALRDYDF